MVIAKERAFCILVSSQAIAHRANCTELAIKTAKNSGRYRSSPKKVVSSDAVAAPIDAAKRAAQKKFVLRPTCLRGIQHPHANM
jgi:hypothetical protein